MAYFRDQDRTHSRVIASIQGVDIMGHEVVGTTGDDVYDGNGYSAAVFMGRGFNQVRGAIMRPGELLVVYGDISKPGPFQSASHGLYSHESRATHGTPDSIGRLGQGWGFVDGGQNIWVVTGGWDRNRNGRDDGGLFRGDGVTVKIHGPAAEEGIFTSTTFMDPRVDDIIFEGAGGFSVTEVTGRKFTVGATKYIEIYQIEITSDPDHPVIRQQVFDLNFKDNGHYRDHAPTIIRDTALSDLADADMWAHDHADAGADQFLWA